MAEQSQKQVVVLAMTGASGAAYGVRLLDVLLSSGCEVHLIISPAAVRVFHEELKLDIDQNHFELETLDRCLAAAGFTENHSTAGKTTLSPSGSGKGAGSLISHAYQNYGASIASGSFLTSGMVVCPCSMGTLASLANGMSSNLIQRAADVHLKERRKLIVVPRETPLGSIQLQNMKVLADAGAVVLPAMPGFYHQPATIQDLVDFIVARICDQLGVRVNLIRRWGSTTN